MCLITYSTELVILVSHLLTTFYTLLSIYIPFSILCVPFPVNKLLKHFRCIFLPEIENEVAECVKDIAARGVLIPSQVIAENLIGYICTRGIVKRYKDKEGRLKLREQLKPDEVRARKFEHEENKVTIEDELEERLFQKHFEHLRQQKPLYSLLYELTNGIKRTSLSRDLHLIRNTFSKFRERKRQNSGSGSELSEMLETEFLRNLGRLQAVDDAYTLDILQLVDEFVEAFQADILLELLLNMGYTLHYFILLIKHKQKSEMYCIKLPVSEKDIRDILGQVKPAKHRINWNKMADDVNNYFTKFNCFLDHLTKQPCVEACLNIEKLVSISRFSIMKNLFN